MAQIPYRANTQSMTFPLLSKLSGRTVINPQADNTYARFVSSDGQSPVDTGIPQIFYCHNVMPSTYGWQSVNYNTVFNAPIPSAGLDFEYVRQVQTAKIIMGGDPPAEIVESIGFKTYMAIGNFGANGVYSMNPFNNTWALVLGAPVLPVGCVMTTATVNGATYIYFSNVGCYIFNSDINTLIPRPLAGVNPANIIGIAAANGYLITYTTTGFAWSSTVNVEDFVPSDTSGAGGGQVQEARGNIVTAVTTALGFIIFTKENAVSVIFSGNAEFPWNLKAIPSAGGVSSSELVSLEQAGGFQQVYSTNGMQQITHARCTTVAPNVTDFIAGNVFEDFNSATNTFTVNTFNWTMRKKLAVVADRYIVLSYGLDPTADMTHALVIDLTQNRMGKLKITHTSCFELRSMNSTITEIPRDSIAFLQRNGRVQVVDFSFSQLASDSVMIIGKFQYVRQKLIEFNQLEIENVDTGGNFQALALPSLNGKNFGAAKLGYLQESQSDYRRYTWDGVIGTNVSWLFKGTFNINSLIGWFSLVGNP